jgi:hypothetical protein
MRKFLLFDLLGRRPFRNSLGMLHTTLTSSHKDYKSSLGAGIRNFFEALAGK